MKWVYLMALCSSLSGECTNSYTDDTRYDDFYSCVKAGTAKSLEILENIDKEDFNKNKLGINLFCKRINEDQANYTPVRSILIK